MDTSTPPTRYPKCLSRQATPHEFGFSQPLSAQDLAFCRPPLGSTFIPKGPHNHRDRCCGSLRPSQLHQTTGCLSPLPKSDPSSWPCRHCSLFLATDPSAWPCPLPALLAPSGPTPGSLLKVYLGTSSIGVTGELVGSADSWALLQTYRIRIFGVGPRNPGCNRFSR